MLKRLFILAIIYGASSLEPIYGQELLWNELAKRADTLYRQRRYAETAQVVEAALSIAEKEFGGNHQLTPLSHQYLKY